jgi:ElaB/YqjD/DUF883 family membrane-anchored ribosome-binding protein
MQSNGTIATQTTAPMSSLPPIPLQSPGFPDLPPEATANFQSVAPVTLPQGTQLFAAASSAADSAPNFWSSVPPEITNDANDVVKVLTVTAPDGMKAWAGQAATEASQVTSQAQQAAQQAVNEAQQQVQQLQQQTQQQMQAAQQQVQQVQQKAAASMQQAQQQFNDAQQQAKQALQQAQQQAQQAQQTAQQGMTQAQQAANQTKRQATQVWTSAGSAANQAMQTFAAPKKG